MADGKGDIAPLGFAIDTTALLEGKKAAEAAAGSFKGMGQEASGAQKAVSGMGQQAQSDAQKIKDAATAAEALAKANTAVADSASKAQQAQTALANAPKPVAPVALPTPGHPVQAKSGGWYADQATADWADSMEAKRAAQRAAEKSPVPTVGNVTRNPLGQAAGGAVEVAEEAGAAAVAATGRMGLLTVAAGAAGAALGTGLVMGLFAAGKAAVQSADDHVLLERRLDAITGSAIKATEAIDGMERASRRSGSENGDQTALRLGLESANLNSDADALTGFGATLAQIDRLGGARADAFDALAQRATTAFKDGRVELGELNAMLDQSPALAGRLADGMGKPIEVIKQMAAEGRLFADDFIAGINRTSEETQQAFNDMKATGEGSFTDLKRAAGSFFDVLSEKSGWNSFTTALTAAITEAFDNAARDFKFGHIGMNGERANLTALPVGESLAVGQTVGGGGQAPFQQVAVASMPFRGSFRQTGQIGDPRGDHTHGGVDFAMPMRTPIYAVANGNVMNVDSAADGNGGGNRLSVIYPGIGRDSYMHLDSFAPGIELGRSVQAGDLLGYSGNSGRSTGPHLHWERLNPNGRRVDPTDSVDPATRRANGMELMQSGSSVEVQRIREQIRDLMATPDTPQRATRLAELNARLRNALSAQQALSRTPYTNAQNIAEDEQFARENGGGGGGYGIVLGARRASRSATEQGYSDGDYDQFLALGITGAVVQASMSTARLRQQAEGQEAAAAAAGRSRMDVERERIDAQVDQFRTQNFGGLESGEITAAVNEYRMALERLTTAQRATANAQELLNAQTQAGISDAEATALAGGGRGYAVALAAQQAREAAIARDGGSVEASRTTFDADNRRRDSQAAAAATDADAAAGRYAAIGSDAFSRRQYERDEALRRAGQEFNGADAQDRLRRQFANEDARAAKDRADADAMSVRMAERQLELSGLTGRARRDALAIMERENALVQQGLLPAGQRLSAAEAASVAANAERLRLIDQQVETMREIDEIAGNTAKAVGGGARSLFSDLFDDGKVEAEKFAGVVKGVVARIGTNIADVLLIRPLERATERLAERATDWVMDRFGGGSSGSSAGGGKDVAIAAQKVAADGKAALASGTRASADLKATLATQTATSAMATLTKSAFAAAAALNGVAGGDTGKQIGAAIAGGAKSAPSIKPAAFGDTFGGIGAAPTLFPMAGGMGLAFEAGPEAVLPLKRGPDGRLGVAGGQGGGGAAPVSVVVNDYRSASSAPVETEATTAADGQRIITMTIRDEQRKNIRGGEMDAAMRDTFGTPRQIARR